MSGCYGQDWASYQSAAPSTSGLAFVFVKATEGAGYTNPLHAAQVAHARGDGMVIGHYHYPHMAADPVAECDYFLAAANPQPGDILCLDWEGYDPANETVPTSRQVVYKAAFLARLAARMPTHQNGTYANTDYLNRDPHGAYGDFLWVATGNKPAGQPGIDHAWTFHQYGASGVDRDYCPLTPAQLKTWAHAKEPQEPDVQLTDKATAHKGTWTPTDQTATVEQWLTLGNLKAGAAADGVKALTVQVAALNATVGVLAKAVGDIHPGVDTATLVTAVEQAIATAVVHVSVDVTGPTA